MSTDPADTASKMADAAGVEPDRLPSLVQKAGVGMYPDAPADDAPEGVREAVEVWREEVPDAVKYEVPLLYWLLGAGTPDYKMPKDAAGYVERPVDGMRCDNCEYYYEAPDGSAVCSQVRGDVEADHYCDLWEPLDAADEKAWVPYVGPDGGEGWQDAETGDVRYTDEPPGDALDPDDLDDEQLQSIADEAGVTVEDVEDALSDAAPPEVDHEEVADKVDGVREYFLTADIAPKPEDEKDINNGFCNAAAQKVFDELGEPEGMRVLEAHTMGARHQWVEYDGKHYDVEATGGVDDYEDLPIWDRYGSPGDTEVIKEGSAGSEPDSETVSGQSVSVGDSVEVDIEGSGSTGGTIDEITDVSGEPWITIETERGSLNHYPESDIESLSMKAGLNTKAWLPYEGPQGGTGWKNAETGDVRYTDEPPGETIEPEEPSPDSPMEVGDRVLLRYEDDTHAGEVVAQSSDPLPDEEWTRRMLDNFMDGETVEDFGGIDGLVDAVWEAGEYSIDGMPEFSAPPPDGIEDTDDLVEAMMTLTSPSVRVKDDRNVWTFDAHDSEKYGGDMQILNLGHPESDRIEPEDADPRDPDQFAWALSEVQIEDAAGMVVDAVDEVGVGPVMEAIEESDQSARLMSSEIVREFQSAGVSGGGVVEPDPLKDHTDPMREELTQEVLDDSEASTWRGARGGWQGSMYDDSRTEPLVAHAMDSTGNQTMPEYTMAAPSIIQDRPSDASKAAIEKASDFTTEKLREAFGDEVTVWRGLSENPHRGTPSEGTGVVGALREAEETGQQAEIEHRPAESWSLSFDTAKLYASGGAVVETTVPVEDIMLSSSAGTLDAVEDDTVVQHEGKAAYGPDQITTGDDLNAPETRLRAALKNTPEDI